MATPNSRPTYRSIGLHGSRRVTNEEYWKVVDASWELIFSATTYTASMIDDLLQKIDLVETPDEYQAKLITLLNGWGGTASERERAAVVRSLRNAGFSPDRAPREDDTQFDIDLRSIASRLLPSNLVERHQWLFAESYVPESRRELLDEGFSYEEREKWIAERRDAAALEVYKFDGIDGIFQLLVSGNASFALGRHLANGLSDTEAATAIIELLHRRNEANVLQVRSAITGLLLKHGDDGFINLAKEAIAAIPVNANDWNELCLEILLACPFEPSVWDMIEASFPEQAKEYWLRVIPSPWRLPSPQYARMIDRLLKAKRPRAAFAAIRFSVEEVDAKTVANLLNALIVGGEEEPDTYPIDAYRIESALAHIHAKKALSVEAMARLEYVFINALRHSKYRIPNLEKRVAENPGSFVELVVLLYRRKDGGEDPEQFRLPSDADTKSITSNVYNALEMLSLTPGSQEDGTIKVDALVRWVSEARRMLIELSREEVGDSCIGQLLGRCPSGTDGVWPHEAVRMALEEIGNDDILRGMALAVYNSLGAVWRGAGGELERNLAAKYEAWAKAVAPDYPVSAKLLRGIADHYVADANWHDTDENVRKRLGRH